MLLFTLLFIYLFFLNDTATPEIDTYGHTLSLHDALPISDIVAADLLAPHDILSSEPADRLLDLSRPVALLLVAVLHFIQDADEPLKAVAELRSEEHTSELQSLMRISYAVFCLTKQKKTVIQIQD